MQYPLNLRFKIVALASQVFATDASGNQIFYVKQKLFKLKENIEIYTDDSKTERLFTVKADRIIDFSPEFTLYDANDKALGKLKRLGRKSIWKSTYEITVGNNQQFLVKETNPWVKVADGFLSEVPIIGLVSGYLLHPEYSITNVSSNEAIASLKKLPAFFEGKYTVENLAINFDEPTNKAFAAMMMVVVLRERMRG